jgi:hypothetical protein
VYHRNICGMSQYAAIGTTMRVSTNVLSTGCQFVVMGPSSVLKMTTSGKIVSHTMSAVTWIFGFGGTGRCGSMEA